MQSLFCPNPACSHTFTAEELRAAGAIKCPQCGRVFQFRAGTDSAPSATPPAPTASRKPAVPAPKPPAAPVPPLEETLPPEALDANTVRKALAGQAGRSGRPPLPVAKVIAPPPASEAATLPPGALTAPSSASPTPPMPVFEPLAQGPLVKPAKGRKRTTKKPYLVLGLGLFLGVLVVGGLAFAVWKLIAPRGGASASARAVQFIGKVRNVKSVDEIVFKLALDDGWSQDHDMRQRMNALGVWKNFDKNRPAWFAVAVKDYGQSLPREAELLRLGIERLEAHFPDTLELEEKAEPAELAGQKGQRLLFKGQQNAVVWWGYMYMVAHHGFGYWFYMAAPSKEEADETLAALQQDGGGFQFHTARTGWREQPPRLDKFGTANGMLTLSAPEGLFERHNPKDQDERGEIFLFARYQKEKDNRKNASVLVLSLDKAGDLKEAMKGARQYLEDKKKEEGKEYRLTPVKEGASDLGVNEAVGNRPGRIAEYRLMFADQPQRYWLVAVVHDGGTAYIIRCDCTWESRQIWREEFMQLLKKATFQKASDAD